VALTKTKKRRVGNFDDRLTFENYTETGGDGMGGSEGEFNPIGTLWASVKPVSGREKIHMDAIDSTISHIVRTRYSELDLSNETKVSWGSRTLNLKYVINEGEDDAYLEIAATEET